jgi:hypothetical protein
MDRPFENPVKSEQGPARFSRAAEDPPAPDIAEIRRIVYDVAEVLHA